MSMNSTKDPPKVLRVTRNKAEAKASYDRMSSFYDLLSGGYENRYKDIALERIDIQPGENVLEVGFGTGYCLVKITKLAGQNGRVSGIDLSTGMLKQAQQRLLKAGLADYADLRSGDAAHLPYEDNQFDVLFSSFCLELFDTPEIPVVLAEMKRVLKPGGRLGILSMSKEEKSNFLVKIYEWSHTRFPKFADCRPIFVEQYIRDAGFIIRDCEKLNMSGLPARIVIAEKE